MNKFKQIKTIKTGLKRKNYKAFFFFIGFTLLIWLFVQMSKTYEHDIELTFELRDVPQNIIFENGTQNLKVQVKQTGFKIFSIRAFNSKLELDFEEIDSLNSIYRYSLLDNKSKIAKSLKIASDELFFEQDEINFKHFRVTTKKLKVLPAIQVVFSKGYDSVQNFIFDPEFIEVSGNDTILNELKYIYTENKILKDVADSISGEIRIQKGEHASINYLVESVSYSLPVVKFTEGTFEIPITVDKNDIDAELVIFPNTVNVNFRTSLSNYERIDESGFEVVARYKVGEDFMFLELVKQPKFVKSASLENYKVDYLIKR